MARKWKTWPRRFGRALGDTNAIVGVIGVAMAGAGATVAAPVLIVTGGLVCVGAVGYAAIKGIPPQNPTAAELVGQAVTLEALDLIDPPVLKLSVSGSTGVGKTTMLRHVLQQSPPTGRTLRAYGAIYSLQSFPAKHVALLDAAGESFRDQFEISDKADVLLIVLDHNGSDVDPMLSDERLKLHEVLLSQIDHSLRRRGRLRRLHFLLNKRDLWEGSSESKKLLTWFNGIVKDWQSKHLAEVVTFAHHSNSFAEDIRDIVAIISDEAAR